MRNVLYREQCVLLITLILFGITDSLLQTQGGSVDIDQYYEIVYPERLTSDVTSHSRTKRSLRGGEFQNVEKYVVGIKDRIFTFNLELNDDFVLPGVVVQHFSGNYTWIESNGSNSDNSNNRGSTPDNSTDSRISPDNLSDSGINSDNSKNSGNKNNGCYYKGTVEGAVSSVASFTLCDGMTGTFGVDGEYYIIEPYKGAVINASKQSTNDTFIPHLVYRLSHTQSNHHFNTTCAVQKTENYKHRRRKRNIQSEKEDSYFSDNYSESYNKLTSSLSSRSTHHISKRSESNKNYVELMVAADHLMLKTHGDKLQQYILSLMSIVNHIYRSPSIKNFIHIVLVKIVIFHSEREGPKISTNAGETLKRFCKWQARNNEDPSSRHHYDTAVLLTRQDICRAPKKCDTLGLAELGTMCDQERSCSIIQDNGISAAYTIAHELGHVFDLPHDDDTRCRRPYYYGDLKAKTHLMSPTIDEHTDPWSWSECSARLLTKFLDAGLGNCLHNVPGVKRYRKHIKRIQKKQPGSLYDADQQCVFVYGKGYRHCPFLQSCELLWCTRNLNEGCRTQHMPMADGTRCGLGKWCMRGQCVKSKLERRVKGRWGRWSKYGKCTRSCGGGIKKAYRECNNPAPRGGGNYCTGKRVKYRHCNTKPCPTNSDDFRVQQCAEYNSQIRLYNITPGSKWIPKYDGIRQKDWCKLYCKADSSPSHFYMLNQKVIDGTKCRPDSDDICVNGKCKRGGCDNKLGSSMKRDRCGVCGGDNASCKTISGFYNTVQYGYSDVSLIPVGATNIDIRQRGYTHLNDDENYLAIKSRNSYILNGDFIISMQPIKIEVPGAVLYYSGTEVVEESINSTGTLLEPLHLQVLSVGNLNPPYIRYSYTMSVNDIRFEWREDKEWTDCSDICNGMRYRKVKCVRHDNNSPVSEQRCDNQPKPATESERCNLFCRISWKIIQDECSSQCGSGMAKRYVSCTLTNKKGTKEIDMAHCERLSTEIGPRPRDVVPCNGTCYQTRWVYSKWTECTSPCGGGLQKRSAKCVDVKGKEVSELYCKQKDLVKERSCNIQPCSVWKIHDWTGCSVTCGEGFRYRKITCHQGEKEVLENQCDYKIKPSDKLECYTGTCPRWLTGEWGECSTSCEMGIAIRPIKCQATNGQVLDDFHCDATLRPFETKQCNLGVCPETTVSTTTEKIVTTTIKITYHWTKGSWTKCSASCGEGFKQRYVQCMSSNGDVSDSSFCDQEIKPDDRETCTLRACGYWRNADWGKCSVTCGRGTQTRQVTCTQASGEPADEIQCDMDVKPDMERECILDECKPEDFAIGAIITNTVVGISHWRVGPWSACSASCGTGWQRRQVLCHDENAPSKSCPEKEKPDTKQSCDAGACPTWVKGAWSQCSASCGTGWQRRQVLCHDENGPSKSCPEKEKPDTKQSCDAGACPTWVKGSWSQCSETCGKMGMQKRTVICQAADGQALPEGSCDIFKRPPDSGMCNNGPCSTNRLWQVGPWSSCSVTCGTGSSQREVICVTESGIQRPSSECTENKPRNTKRCTLHACPKWTYTKWGKCSKTCGEGIKTRGVACTMGNGDVVPDYLCLGPKKPRTERKCLNKMPCSDYMWRFGNWSECSKDCGFGFKTREVYCSDGTDKHVDTKLCNSTFRPKPRRRCSEFPCPFMWNSSPWSECSSTCNKGVQRRRVGCQAVTKEGWILPGEVPYGCRDSEKPTETQECNLGPCNSRYRWITGPWGECSTRCGYGYKRRQVQCVDFTGQKKRKKLCNKQYRPTGRQHCYNGPCYATSCKQLKEQTSIRKDGSYKLFVQGRLIEIYCKNMKRPLPEEYITLLAGEKENYAEIYPYRLKRQKTCPYNGTREDPCSSKLCRHTLYKSAGKTMYSKIKIDILTLKIKATDMTFASSNNGRDIPFGSAGDCYSATDCPQGQFSINLSGTGLIVAPNTTWVSQGSHASQRLARLQEGEIIKGWCGGLCGWCSSEHGIQLQVLT